MSEKISLALVVFLVNASLSAADPPPTASQPPASGVLLLRNGQVIEGHIERNGDYYTVTSPGQEMNVHASTVDCLCRDLRDGYRRKKAAIQPGDVQQHLQLLLWCERQGLLDCARQELDAVEAIDAKQPMIAVLRRRLKIESQPPSESPRLTEKVETPPSDDQLDQMTRGMPPGTVEAFVLVVQPILLNHYPGARGYALPDNKRLQLMRPPLGETPGRRLTQRNLHAVLQCIDWNNPGGSSLLRATSGLPSGMTASEFPGRYSTQYQKLTQWVYLVAQKPMPAEEGAENTVAEVAVSESPAPRTLPAGHIPYMPQSIGHGKEKEKPDAEANATSAEKSGGRVKPKTASKAAEDENVSPRSQVERAAAQAIDSIDPYDPAAFNNQSAAPTELPTPAARVLHGGS